MFGKHISLVIYVRGHTYPGETHITKTHITITPFVHDGVQSGNNENSALRFRHVSPQTIGLTLHEFNY